METRRKARRQGGFTLVEILVVIVILSLLATIVGGNVIKYLSESEVDTAKVQVLRFKEVVDTFRVKEGRIPENLDELIQPNEKGVAYIEGFTETPVDPWGNPYEIREDDQGYEIISYGPDKQPDTEDDISSRTAKDKG